MPLSDLAVMGIGSAPVYFAVAGLLLLTLPPLYWLWRAERRAAAGSRSQGFM